MTESIDITATRSAAGGLIRLDVEVLFQPDGRPTAEPREGARAALEAARGIAAEIREELELLGKLRPQIAAGRAELRRTEAEAESARARVAALAGAELSAETFAKSKGAKAALAAAERDGEEVKALLAPLVEKAADAYGRAASVAKLHAILAIQQFRDQTSRRLAEGFPEWAKAVRAFAAKQLAGKGLVPAEVKQFASDLAARTLAPLEAELAADDNASIAAAVRAVVGDDPKN